MPKEVAFIRSYAHTISLAFLKDLKVAASPQRYIPEVKFPKQLIKQSSK